MLVRSSPAVILGLLLTLAPALAAQIRDSTRLPELVVTATRIPTPRHAIGSSSDVLLPGELARRQITSLREALALLPGAVVLGNGAPGAVSSLFLRGVSSTQMLLLVDGIRINDANTSPGSFLGGADLTGLGRLEVVRGPQSTLYGGAAIGGVVAIDAAPGDGPAHGSAEMEGGSYQSWRGRLSAAGRTGRLGIAAALTANGTENQRRPNDWDQRTQLIRIDYLAGSRLLAGATFRGLQHSYVSPGDIRTSNTTPEGTTTFENHLATVWLEAAPVARWRSRITLGGQQQYIAGTGRFNGGEEFRFTLDNTRRVLDWQNTLRVARTTTLIAGVNREWSTATGDGDSQDERLLGLYAEAAATPVPSLGVTAGIRSDNYNTFEDAVTWRLTVAWRVTAGTKLRASYGTGFMPPSLSARFGSVFQKPNPAIRPERSRGWDAGLDQDIAAGRTTLSLTWFHNALDDLIGFESAPFPDRGRSVNIDRARTQGLEAGARVQAGILDARVAWTLLSAVSRSETDPALERLIRRPRHTLSGDLGLKLGDRGLLGLGVVAVADREDSDFNSFPAGRIDPGDYAVGRLYGGYQAGRRISLRARIENLFNSRYEPVYGFPGLGRSVVGSVTLGF